MIEDRRIRVLVDNPKIFDCFPGVKIRGGVSYFLWDREYSGNCEFPSRVAGVIRSTMMRDLRNGDGVLFRDNRPMTILAKTSNTKHTVDTHCTVTNTFVLTMRRHYPHNVAKPFAGANPLIYTTNEGASTY